MRHDDNRLKINNAMALQEDTPLYPQITGLVRAFLIYAEDQRLDIDPGTLEISEDGYVSEELIFPVLRITAEAEKGRDWESPEERGRRQAREAVQRKKARADRYRHEMLALPIIEAGREIEKKWGKQA